MAKKTRNTDGLQTYLRKRPALASYLARIGAELANFRKAVIREKEPGGYSRNIAELHIAADGKITHPPSKPLPDYAVLKEGEVSAIAAEFAKVTPPIYQPFKCSSSDIDPARMLGIDLNSAHYKKRLVMFFPFWNAEGDQLLMVEQRTEFDGEKQCVLWSYWEVDGCHSWQPMEPDGPLPLFGLERLKGQHVVFLHEGPSSAAAVQEMLADETARAQHPWAAELSQGVHLGWPGGVWRWDDVDWAPLQKAHLSRFTIVADNDKTGKFAAEKIGQELAKHNPHVVLFDNRFPPKFDLADAFPKSLFEKRGGSQVYAGPALKELCRPVTPEGWLERLNEQYCVVTIGAKTRVLYFLGDDTGRESANYMRAADFKEFHANQFVRVKDKPKKAGAAPELKNIPAGEFWWKHPERRTYSGVIFEPERGSIVSGQLNLWRGFGVEPKAGDWSRMREHIRSILANGDEEMDAFIVRWSAWKLQNPGKPSEVALVFRGGEGTGKGFFARALGTLFGRHSHHISDRRHLTGNFNAHLRDCCLLFADEAFWPGDKAGESTLKRIITEPTLTIEPKGVDPFEVRNRLGVVMASNSDWVVPASIGARRFAVADVSDAERGSRSYFDPLQEQLDHGGYEAMLYDLRAMDLEDWRPLGNIPQNAALRDQKLLSLKPEEQWLFGLCQAGTLPNPDNLRASRTSMQELRKHACEVVKAMVYVSDTQLGLLLRKFGCVHSHRLRGSRAWVFPPLAECRAKWDKLLPGVEWDGPEQTDWVLPSDDTLEMDLNLGGGS